MRHFLRLLALTTAACGAATAALAHAFLAHAMPGVGMTVSGSPLEIELSFTEGIVAAFSGVKLTSAKGVIIPLGKLTIDPAKPNVLHSMLGRPLTPGTYVVSWHVVSVDTHRTQGTYKFTVTP